MEKKSLKNRELAKKLAQMKVKCTQLQKDLFFQRLVSVQINNLLNAVRELCEICVQHMSEFLNADTNIMRMATVSENPPNRSVAGESANMSGRSFVNNTARNKMLVVQPSTSANDSEIWMSLSKEEGEQTPQENVTPSVENADRDKERKRRRSRSRDRERKREKREKRERDRGERLEYIKTDDGGEVRIKEETLDDYPDYSQYQSQPYDQSRVKYEDDEEEQKYEPERESANGSRRYEEYEEGEAY